jgi:hypothetical protein
VCGDVSTRPRFHRASDFKDVFHRPDKVAEVIRKMQTAPEHVNIPAIEPPRLQIAAEAAHVKDADLTLTLAATPRGPRDTHRARRLILWVGDYRYQEWSEKDLPDSGPFLQRVTIPRHRLRNGVNRLTLQCYGRGGTSDRAQLEVVKEGPPSKPRLFVVLIGVVDYSQIRFSSDAPDEDRNLPGVGVDVELLKNVWKRQEGKLFQTVSVTALRDEAVNRDSVQAALQAVAGQARPDDLLVLYLGGHGYAEPGAKDTLRPGTFTFVGPRFDFERPKQTGITSERLYQELTGLRCRKLVLLNSCHSGDVTTNPVRDLARDGVGPLIFSACDHNESAFVNDFTGGLFTRAVIEALRDRFAEADQDQDGRVDTHELAAYVRRRVPQLLAGLRTDKTQTPTFFPPLGSMERFPLAAK